jgi:hypothetical protein
MEGVLLNGNKTGKSAAPGESRTPDLLVRTQSRRICRGLHGLVGGCKSFARTTAFFSIQTYPSEYSPQMSGVTSMEPCLPLTHVTDSQRSRKHSSGLIPESTKIVAIGASGSRATARYLASSAGVITRSRCFSPRSSCILGADEMTPHSTARRRTRRSTWRERLTLAGCNPSLCRYAAKSATLSPVILSSFQFCQRTVTIDHT